MNILINSLRAINNIEIITLLYTLQVVPLATSKFNYWH